MSEERDWEAERRLMESHAGQARLEQIAASYSRLTGKYLIPDGAAVEAALWNLDAVLVAHGNEADPIFFYANRAALSLFACPHAFRPDRSPAMNGPTC